MRPIKTYFFQKFLVGDPRRNATSQLKIKVRLSLKSDNLNIKHDCKKCVIAKKNKQSGLDREAAFEKAGPEQ